MKRETLHNVKTGETVERYPVDAREMLLTGEWSRRKPAKLSEDGKAADDMAEDRQPAAAKSERQQRIAEATAVVMEGGDRSIILKDGMPHVSAVSKAAGFEVTAAERDTAWREYEKSRR